MARAPAMAVPVRRRLTATMAVTNRRSTTTAAEVLVGRRRQPRPRAAKDACRHAAVALASARLLFSEGVRLILFMQCLLEEFDEEMEDRSDDW